MKESADNSYIAFISYRHKELDKRAAELVQKKIENYVIPREFRKSPEQKHFGHCFRDEDELTASSSLSESIYRALDASEYLIVICTPDLPQSEWCRQEIEYFLKTHDREHIIAVLADGTPAESFSEQLVRIKDEEGNVIGDCEPLAANIAGPGHTLDKKALKKEAVRIFAALLNCPFDALWQRERRAKTLRLLSASAAALAVLAVFLVVVLNRNAKINEQNRELEKNMSSVLTDSGFEKLEKLQVDEAIKDGLSALESGDPEIYDHRAVKLLSDALGAYQTDRLTSYTVYRQQTEINELWMSADEKHVLLLDSIGTIRCLSADTFTVEWQAESADPKSMIYADFPDRILYKSKNGVYALSLTDGSLLWSYQHEYLDKNYFQALSFDRTVFAILDRTTEAETPEGRMACVRFLDTSDGHVIQTTVLRIENHAPFVLETCSPDRYAASFSEDGKALVFALPSRKTLEDGSTDEVVAIVKIDLESNEQVRVMGNSIMTYQGFFLSPDHERLLYAALDPVGLQYMLSCPIPISSAEDVTYTTVGYNYHVTGGAWWNQVDGLSAVNRCKMLLYRNNAAVFCDDCMFVFDTDSTECKKNYMMTGKIVNAYWLDEENGTFELVCSDGWILDYTFAPEGRPRDPNDADAVFTKMYGESLKHTVSRSVPVGGSLMQKDEGCFLLSIDGDDPGQLIRTEYATDPHGTVHATPHDKRLSSYAWIPDTELVAGLVKAENSLLIFDRDTGEAAGSIAYEGTVEPHNLAVIDKDHILIGAKIYGIDGSEAPYGETSEVTGESRYPDEHIILSDGRVMSTAVCYSGFNRYAWDGEYFPEFYPIWLDGKLISASADPASAVILAIKADMNTEEVMDWTAKSDEKKFGANGLLARYGNPMVLQDDILVRKEAPCFAVFDVHTERRHLIEDPYPEAEDRKYVLSNEKPWMAVGYSDGMLCLADVETESFKTLSTYAPSEILALGFSEDDRFLAVLRTSGRIDLFDTASGTLTASVSSSMLYRMIQNGDSCERELKLTVIEEDKICVSAFLQSPWYAQSVLIDVKEQVVLAEFEDVYGIDAGQRLIYKVGNSDLYSYPVYSVDDLIAWAKEKTGQETTETGQ